MLRGKGVFLTSLGQSLRPPESFKGCLGSGKGAGGRAGLPGRGGERVRPQPAGDCLSFLPSEGRGDGGSRALALRGRT